MKIRFLTSTTFQVLVVGVLTACVLSLCAGDLCEQIHLFGPEVEEMLEENMEEVFSGSEPHLLPVQAIVAEYKKTAVVRSFSPFAYLTADCSENSLPGWMMPLRI